MRRYFPFLLLLVIIGGCLWAQENATPQRLALRRLVERADTGDAKSLYDLARLLETGYDSIPLDSVRSLALYLASAEKEYPPAMNYIGFRYFTGNGLRKDIDSALYWIRNAAARGDITAAANLGYLLTESEEIPHDEEEAAKWISMAAEAGVNEAQIKLIEIKEEEWKNLPADSALQLGMGYYLGTAPIIGVKLIEISAGQNNPQAIALLGDAYSKGIGVPYDHEKSTNYFYKAAIAGDPSAQFIIAEMLEIFPESLPAGGEETSGFLDDFLSPSFWYEKASQAGVTEAESAYRQLYSYPPQ